ncbi:hypothetical protein M422DRAFT_246328 [Sphaerobolus stellatus SS14]|nr:hypothetical protein M422DRAFT_246328 [Sphaerobolus stellatus SS14]
MTLYHKTSASRLHVSKPDYAALRPPKTPLRRWAWRWRMWVGGTFATCFLETWEFVILMMIAALFTLIFVAGLRHFMQNQAAFIGKRLHFYLLGNMYNTEQRAQRYVTINTTHHALEF